MPLDNRPIIADQPAPRAGRQVVWGVLCGALAAGSAAAVYYASQDLTLSHYDARAHLVVARRIVDSLTPGWQQIGAVWLPLPHLINLLPAQIDANYQTGYASTALSIGALALGLAALAGYLFRRTGSAVAAVTAPALVLLNPNVLYLQSTPMTEPLLFGLSLVALATVDAWIRAPSPRHLAHAGWALAALTLTRYEGWAISAALVALAGLARRERGALVLLSSVAGAVGAFLLLSRGSTGHWIVISGFFVPDARLLHRPLVVLYEVLSGGLRLGGDVLLLPALLGAAVCLGRARRAPVDLLPLALLTAAALPLAAFFFGHPVRVRYMVPLIVAGGTLAALGLARLPRSVRTWAALGVCATAVFLRPPLDSGALMVREAQWETPLRLEREAVTRYLEAEHDGMPILASMGSLAHYMQETAASGFELAAFVHEGNGALWTTALAAPARHVGWVLAEERAEGGDAIAARGRVDPLFLSGFQRVAEGGGLALYRHRP